MLRLPRLMPSPMWVPFQNESYTALTLMTSAPRSASIRPVNGPATPSPRSRTRTPASGWDSEAAAAWADALPFPVAPLPAAPDVPVAWPPARASASTSSVCWPDRGAGPATAPGVAEKSISSPACRMDPTSGSSTSATHPSATKKGSDRASTGERMSEMPSPVASAARSQVDAGNFRNASASSGYLTMPSSSPSPSIDTRSGSSRYEVSRPTWVGSSLAAAFSTQLGRSVQWWTHRPSAHSKMPSMERESMGHIQYSGASGFSTRCQLRATAARAPCSSEVATR